MKHTKSGKPRVRRGRGKGQVGRPIELTDAVLARIAKHASEGNYLETAVDLEGVSIHSVRELIRNGNKELRRMPLDGDSKPEPGLERAVTFARAMKKARAKAELDDLAAIKRAGKTQWQAHAWRLERRQPDRWARTNRHEHSGPGGKPISVGVSLSPEQLKNLSNEELNVLRGIATKLADAAVN